jgi:hypothetical protein
MLEPQEIMRRFPVGRILELQSITKDRIAFLGKILSAIDLVQRHLQVTFKDAMDPPNGEAITETIDSLIAAQPFDAMVSVALGNGWNGPDAYLHAQTNASCLRKIIWSLIYADIVTDYDIDRQTWLRLKLSLLENPPGAGILVVGYDFKEADLGHKGSSNGRIDVCPDYPPASFMDDGDGQH